ncbi:IS66 family insertion sequence element accessory protein TnpA [Mariniphaga sp.]|uniref:IS66 family insertion sequence element accessory protein TnpA n=1 Tax=Mariniphaga sp. TaxID=1954475 RepID=UPI00356A5F2C
MRKNQKASPATDGYSKEEMYLAIELWQESGLSQSKFCSRENLSVKTFSNWYRKYKKEEGLLVGPNKEVSDTFTC